MKNFITTFVFVCLMAFQAQAQVYYRPEATDIGPVYLINPVQKEAPQPMTFTYTNAFAVYSSNVDDCVTCKCSGHLVMVGNALLNVSGGITDTLMVNLSVIHGDGYDFIKGYSKNTGSRGYIMTSDGRFVILYEGIALHFTNDGDE